MVGAAFCHICGLGRHRLAAAPSGHWSSYLRYFHFLEFSNVKRWVGLPLAPLCAFLVGVAFLIVGLSVGLMSVHDYDDFQAIQLWRIEWLMAACASFLAGILLKSRKSEED
jgi:cytosine/uracil/thiamine/allantoin permease